MEFRYIDGWLVVPPGTYTIGLDADEAERLWSAYECTNRSSFAAPGDLPIPLLAAVPRRTVTVMGFQIKLEPDLARNVSFREARRLAKLADCSLPTECEWEIAERNSLTPLSLSRFDEWCLDYFDWNRNGISEVTNPVAGRLIRSPIGCPSGRHVIRGQGIDFYHPSMRFHGGISDSGYFTTGFRLVKRDAPLCHYTVHG